MQKMTRERGGAVVFPFPLPPDKCDGVIPRRRMTRERCALLVLPFRLTSDIGARSSGRGGRPGKGVIWSCHGGGRPDNGVTHSSDGGRRGGNAIP